jgi:hypothetical protein
LNGRFELLRGFREWLRGPPPAAATGHLRPSPIWELPPAVQREIDPQAQPAPDDKFDQRVAL